MVLLPVQHQLSKETPMSQHTEQRRTQAIDQYLAADKVEEGSKRPKSHPTHTPQHIEQAVVSLHLTLHHNGTNGGVVAIIQALTQQGVEPVPSRRTIYRILRRHHKEVQ